MKTTTRNAYVNGLKKGIPIGLGYISVSFTFGFMAVSKGLPLWLVVFISFSNLTSAGQFAGTNLILAGAAYAEIALTTFVINIRYMLMSLALTQKFEKNVTWKKRLLIGHGVTDEVFALASMEPQKLSAPFMYGLMTMPIIGWTLGTFLGGAVSSFLPIRFQNAMGIALYAMFIAIIIPPTKKEKSVFVAIILAAVIMCVFHYVPLFHVISSGFQVILATIITAGILAFVAPIKEEETCEPS